SPVRRASLTRANRRAKHLLGRASEPGGRPGLQNLCAAARAVVGGFDSHALPTEITQQLALGNVWGPSKLPDMMFSANRCVRRRGGPPCGDLSVHVFGSGC